MLETILLKLPTQDLLRCRGVSKLWKAFALPICRRRHVTPDLYEIFSDTEKLEAFYATFEGSSDLPWSACSLKAYKLETTVEYEAHYGKPLHYLDPVQLKRFVDAFGPHVRKFKVKGDNLHAIVPALLEMPNLEVLVSGIKATANDMRIACSGNPLEFSKLKRLQIAVRSDADMKLTEFMCTNARKLDSILVKFKLNIDDQNRFRRSEVFSEDNLRRLISVVSRIPSIELKLSNAETMEFFEELSVTEMKVKDLKLHFEIEVDDQRMGYYRAIEQFLASKSNCLEKLNVEVFSSGGLVGGPLGLPVFTKLKELDVNCECISSSTSPSFLHPFVPNQFPSLVKISINITIPDEINQEFVTVFGTGQFDSVKELTLFCNDADLHPNPMLLEWGHIFPNLVKLALDGVTVESYSYIYEKLTNLEHLRLCINTKFIFNQVQPNGLAEDEELLTLVPQDPAIR